MAPDRERSQSPMGRTSLPATVMNVKMCCTKCEEKAKEECEEVEGVVKVVTDQSENKVIVYGVADPSALLKKMRRHLDKHAMYWHTDDANPVAPPFFPAVDTREGFGAAHGPPLHTGTILPTADPRDRGPPLADSREILHQRELQNIAAAHENRERGAGSPHKIVREVVFVDAKDGTPVDPRNVLELDPAAAHPRDGRNFGVDARDLVRPVERMELQGGEYPMRDPNHGQAPREVVVVKDVDPRQVQQHHPRDGHGPGELREVQRIHDPRDHPPARELHEVPIFTGMRPVDDQLRPIDSRNMMRNPVPPREPVLDRGRFAVHEGLIPVRTGRDSQEVRPIATGMRPVDDQLRPIDSRNMMRNPAPPLEPVLDQGRVAVPEGLIPVRTGRDSREVHFTPAGAGQYRNDLSPRSPRDAEYLSPRQHHAAPPDRGPRSPRGDHAAWDYYSGADHGQAPRSPRFEAPRSPGRGRAGVGDGYDPRPRPVLDRELSFNAFGPGPAGPPAVPLPYEPRDAAAAPASFDFHAPGPALHHPRSPRSSRTDHDPQLQVRGYGDIDPRQFRQAAADHPASTSPRGIRPVQRYNDIHQDAAATMIRNRDDGNLYRSRDADGGSALLSPRSPHYYSSEPSFRSPHDERGGVGAGEYYEPKESYFSDYHPSQNYQPGPLATQDIDELPTTNPNYKKHILSDPTF